MQQQHTRRDLLAGAAAAAAAVSTAGSRAIAASDQVNVAVIGLGGMGTGHLKHLVEMKSARIGALCDVDSNHLERAGQLVYKAVNTAPKSVADFRKLLDDKSIDAFIIATPHHWHAPIAVAAMKAGKDVYVEKIASHVFREGRVMVDTAKLHKRVFQHGTQMRSSPVTAKARELLDAGVLGKVKMSKAWNQQKLAVPAQLPDSPAPATVDYNMWLGPAARHAFNPKRFHVEWRMFREYGNGSLGDDGGHDLDMARFGLGANTHPVRITAHGSRLDFPTHSEYPDNMTITYQFGDGKVLLYEERSWTPYGQYGVDSGNAFYGTDGFMVFSRRGFFQVYLGPKEEKGPGMRGTGGGVEHMQNFLDCVRSRQQTNADAEVAHLTCGLVHLGEAAYRVGRILNFDPQTETVRIDPQAQAMLTKKYRAPFAI